MKKGIHYAAVAAMALGSFAFVGCEKEDTTTARRTDTPSSTAPAVDVDVDVNKDRIRAGAERTGDAIKEGVDKTGEVVARGAEKTGDALRDAGGAVSDAARRAGDSAERAVDRTAERTDRAVDNANENAQEAGARVGGTAAAPDAEDIQSVIAQVTEAALTKGGLDDMAERFVDADRNRLGQGNALDANDPQLDGRIDQFKKDWQAKYNQEFDINDVRAAFPAQTFMIAQGEIGKAAAGVNVDVDRRSDGGVNVDVDNRSGVDRPDSNAADTNRNDPGRNIATVRVAAAGQGTPLTVPMIHEAPDAWKIDVPDTLTAQKLRANVLAHLTAADNPAQWPQDVNQAYGQVAQHVLMAVMDKPAQQQ